MYHAPQYHLVRALGAANIGYLIENGTFDSNPCGGPCMLNPVYDILPRNAWLVESSACQRWEEFLWDPVSQTMCCPSPDYCCPNSVRDCADPSARLFDLQGAHGGAGVSSDVLVDGWRRHFLARLSLAGSRESRALIQRANDDGGKTIVALLNGSLCSAGEWRGVWDVTNGSCRSHLLLTDEGTTILRREWLKAVPWAGAWPVNEDDTNQWAPSHRQQPNTPRPSDVQLVGRLLESNDYSEYEGGKD